MFEIHLFKSPIACIRYLFIDEKNGVYNIIYSFYNYTSTKYRTVSEN